MYQSYIYSYYNIVTNISKWERALERRKRSNPYIKENERYYIERRLRAGISKAQIARELGRSREAISREVARGSVEQVDTMWRSYMAYKADVAQRRAKERQALKGATLKIGDDYESADTISRLIIVEGWSPDAIAGADTKHHYLNTHVCTKTIYNYVRAGVLEATEDDLPMRGKQKRAKAKLYRKQHHQVRGTSIEERPAEVGERREFGHWEGDLVVGKRGTKTVVMTIVERMTRFAITLTLKGKYANYVVAAIDKVERIYRKHFKHIFKSITFDNGTEFSDFQNMMRTVYQSYKSSERTKVYYAHPYSSYERGSNENFNRLLRRKGVTKGKNIGLMGAKLVKIATEKVNNLPRKVLGYLTARQCYDRELRALGVPESMIAITIA
jgi:IS30 family transposase